MKKIFWFNIVIIIFIIVVIRYNNISKTFTQDRVTYALTLDGVSVNNFPSKGVYRVDVECSNANGKWLYDEWKLAVEDINGTNATCDISFNTISTTYLNNYIIGLSGTTQGTGQVVQENGYRYEGKDPNNYIWFNNELWRIIGVFNSASHGVSGQNLVKIMRADSIGGLVWNKNKVNDWTQASLMNLLNGVYLNSENGSGGEYCYGYETNTPGNCDYTETGINDTYRSMIENVTWHLGGYSGTNATAEAFYGYERGTTVYSGRPTSTTGYIGLMYPSDYGYSVLASSCARTTNLGDYDSSSCAGQSWLYSYGYEWTITHKSSANDRTFIVYSSGNILDTQNTIGYNLRPAVYLKSAIYVLDGDGSIINPYIIGM